MIRRLLLQVARDNAGAAIIELALAAPILATMVVGVSDISIAYGKKLELEQAAQRAMEKVMQTTGEDTPEDTIKKEAVCQYNGSVPDTTTGICPGTISAANVTVAYSLKCNGTATDYSLDCDSGQTELRYITATVTDTYTPMFNMHFGTQSDGTYHLSTQAGVRVG
jgi:Flp pilus assembly protein TadG